MKPLTRTRLSLFYLSGYLLIIGLGLLLFPTEALRLLLSSGHYDDAMIRLAGMFMAGVGMNVAGIIASRAEASYLSTLLVRGFFLGCVGALYAMSRDPFFLTLSAIVVFGVALTAVSYFRDRTQASASQDRA